MYLASSLIVFFAPVIVWNFPTTAQKQIRNPAEKDSIVKVNFPVLPFDSLTAFVASVKSSLPRANSERFVKPAPAEMQTFTQAVSAVLQGNLENAAVLANAVNYDVSQLNDQTANKTYWVLIERQTNFRGLGTYIFDLSFGRNLILQVPHPLFDINTPEEATQIFQQTDARGVFISGTHRCANAERSPCSGTTTACDDVSAPFRVSDASHFTGNFFQAAHQATLNQSQIPVSISLHGNAVSSLPDVTLSNGTDKKDSFGSLVNRFRRQLKNRGVSAGSCNYVGDKKFSLCGTTNVQGRLSNNASNACTTSAQGASGLFLHVEQHLNIRNNPALLIDALKNVIPLN